MLFLSVRPNLFLVRDSLKIVILSVFATGHLKIVISSVFHLQRPFRAKGLREDLKIKILHQLLTSNVHFVRTGCFFSINTLLLFFGRARCLSAGLRS